jgi:flagellar basal-body rod protein FlgB
MVERSVEMIGSNAFNYINVLNKAANASWKRNEVIANNIANVDTPGYKRKDVQFQSYLQSAILGDGSLDSRVADANKDQIDATVYTDNASLSYRLDGNNVDIDTESANLAENQIRYQALLESMTQEFSRIKAVLASR